jgi:hypothetical protein
LQSFLKRNPYSPLQGRNYNFTVELLSPEWFAAL